LLPCSDFCEDGGVCVLPLCHCLPEDWEKEPPTIVVHFFTAMLTRALVSIVLF